jgi:hypothetical protein
MQRGGIVPLIVKKMYGFVNKNLPFFAEHASLLGFDFFINLGELLC